MKKRGSLVSRNWSRKNVFLTYLLQFIECVSEYIPFVTKRVITNTQTQTKKLKKLMKKRDIQKKPKKKRSKKMLLL